MMSRILGALAVSIVALSGCGGVGDEELVGDDTEALNGADLYTSATFGGNGRTCATCHPTGTGTFSPADAQARHAANKKDPLFRSLDSDNGKGKSFKTLLEDATVNVEIALPANVKIAGNP